MKKLNLSASGFTGGSLLSRSEMKKIAGGSGNSINAICLESCLPHPIEEKDRCIGNCPVCFRVTIEQGFICISEVPE
ncbi:hypothetical protein [Pedobacter africanus]|uniref:Uncharacterized protein n=1 Tax=Pedobacter africanus TaxID=151894 RepID=A0ACC6KZC2_9SPHI|nr:hypothetical protein [Pedobacter africanus]MDR6784492.1 hypothetical protein [Pedobacter africanus]